MRRSGWKRYAEGIGSSFGDKGERNLAAGFILFLMICISTFYYIIYTENYKYITKHMALSHTGWGFFNLNDSQLFYQNVVENGRQEASQNFAFDLEKTGMAFQMRAGLDVAIEKQTTKDASGHVYVCILPQGQESCYWMIDWIALPEEWLSGSP